MPTETSDPGILANPADRKLARQLISAGQARAVQYISLGVSIVVVVSVPFLVAVDLNVDAQLAGWFFVIAGSILAYAIAMILLARRRWYRPWMDWVNAVAEVSLPTLVMALDAYHVNAAYALTSAPTFLYSVSVLFSAIRLRRTLVMVVAVLGAAELMAMYALLRGQLPAELVAVVPSLALANVVQKACYIIIAGVLAVFVCNILLGNVGQLVARTRIEQKARSALGKVASSQVADLLIASTTGSLQLGEKRVITVLFVDIRDFTRFAEQRDPGVVVAFLNTFFKVMCSVVDRNGGIVNKFLGDGLMAIFGAPVALEQHAQAAAQTAREMGQALEVIRSAWNLPDLEISIGLHTGEAVVGVMGAEDRGEYTAIGDTVNVASRIEGLNRQYQTRVLLSAETKAWLGPEAPVREVGEVQVKGRARPVKVLELLGAA